MSGLKFNDLNGNGVRDMGEPGLGFWAIHAYLDSNGDGVLTSGETIPGPVDVDETDATGQYELTLQPGTYVLCEILGVHPGWVQSAPANTVCQALIGLGPGGHAVTVTTGPVTGKDFGNFQGNVRGVKFNDLNGNGLRDTGEPGLGFWVIHAYLDTNGDGVLSSGETSIDAADVDETDEATGQYELTLQPGRYILCEVPRTGWVQTAPANTICPVTIGFSPGGHAVTATTGLVTGKDFGSRIP